jgi:hypothetical protein
VFEKYQGKGQKVKEGLVSAALQLQHCDPVGHDHFGGGVVPGAPVTGLSLLCDTHVCMHVFVLEEECALYAGA